MNLSDYRRSPARPSPAAGWSSSTTTAAVFPCCVADPLAVCPRPYRGGTGGLESFVVPQTAAYPFPTERRLPQLAFSGPARRSLHVRVRRLAELPRAALRPRRLWSFCYLPNNCDCFRLQRAVTGVALAPPGSTTPFTAHARDASERRLCIIAGAALRPLAGAPACSRARRGASCSGALVLVARHSVSRPYRPTR
jgi:hypothetical protein